MAVVNNFAAGAGTDRSKGKMSIGIVAYDDHALLAKLVRKNTEMARAMRDLNSLYQKRMSTYFKYGGGNRTSDTVESIADITNRHTGALMRAKYVAQIGKPNTFKYSFFIGYRTMDRQRWRFLEWSRAGEDFATRYRKPSPTTHLSPPYDSARRTIAYYQPRYNAEVIEKIKSIVKL